MAKHHVYKLVRETKTKVLNVSASLILVAMSLGGALPAFLASPVNAIGNPTVVTPTNEQGWALDSSNGASSSYVIEPGAPLGTGALQLTTAANNDSVVHDTKAVNVPLDTIQNLSYETYRTADGGNPAVDLSMRLSINYSGTGSNVDDQLMFEPYYNNAGNPSSNTWQSWNVASGKFWSNNDATYNGLGGVSAGSYASNFSLSDVLHDHPQAKLVNIVLSMGTWNPGANVLVDNVNINGTTYDFDPVSITPCTITNTLNSPSLSAWNTTDTRTSGHYQVTSNGLHIWTDDSTSQAKVAAYYPTSFALANTGTQNSATAINYTDNFGSAPGLQLVVDLNNDGTPDGILVGEGLSYPGNVNDWWLSGSSTLAAPHPGSSNIFGHPYGTLDEWLALYPNAQVSAVGFSLGSGVHADGVLNSFTLGCTTYTFNNLPPTLTVTTPAENSVVSTKANGNNLVIKGSFTDDVKANYATFQLVHNGSSVAIGTLYGYGSVYNPAATYANADGSYTFNLPVPSNLADGAYSLFYVGTDFTGGVTTRMERKFTIDNTAPSTPTITHPTARQWFKTTPIVDSWTAATDANGIASYQIAYHYDDGHTFGSSTCPGLTIPGVSGFIGCRDTSGTSRDHQPGLNEQGGVTIWVRAFDNAGNASSWSQPVHYYYDHTAPTTTIVAPTGVVGHSFSVSGDAHDNLSLNRVYVQLVNRQSGQRYGGTTINLIPNGINPQGVDAHWTANFDASTLNLPDGDYAANAEVVDMAGNTFNPGWTANFTVDTTAPVVTLLTPSGQNAKGSGQYTVTGTVTDINFDANDTFFSIVANNNDPKNITTTLPAAVISHNGDVYTVSATFDTTLLKNGEYLVTLGSTDLAGNVAAPASNTVVINNNSNSPQFSPAVQTTGGRGGGNGGNAPATFVPQVLGTEVASPTDTTTTSGSTDTSNSGTNGHVKGDSTVKIENAASKHSSNFLGLGWWWLLILAVLAGFIWLTAGRRSEQD